MIERAWFLCGLLVCSGCGGASGGTTEPNGSSSSGIRTAGVPAFVLQRGHTARLYSARFSPDGLRVVSAADDDTAKIWDVASGRLLATLSGHIDGVTAAEFSPDGRRVVTASIGASARVWDAASGDVLVALEGHRGGLRTASFSPDGRRVVTSSSDRTARVWDATTGAVLATLEGHTDDVMFATFSPDGRRIATASRDRTARIWDASSGQPLGTLEGHAELIYTVEFSLDGGRVTTASDDQTARVWNAGSGELVASLQGHTDNVVTASFSPDGSRVLTSSWDGTTKVWDAASGDLQGSLGADPDGVSFASFSPNGRLIVAGGGDRRARVWDAATGNLVATLEGHADQVNAASFSADGRRIVTGGRDAAAIVWDATSGDVLVTFGDAEGVSIAAFSPDARRVVTATWPRSADTAHLHTAAHVWDPSTGDHITSLRGHTESITTVSFSPDGRRIATGSHDRTAKIWDAETGNLIASLGGHDDRLGIATFSPDGRRVVTAHGGRAKVWDAVNGNLLFSLRGVFGPVFSSDSRRLLTTSLHSLDLWDATSGARRASHESIAGSRASLHPDGRLAVTAGGRWIKMWDTTSGSLLATLDDAEAFWRGTAFSSDGRRVLAWGGTRVAVWDVASRNRLASLDYDHDGLRELQSAAFSSDGRRVITVTRDDVVGVWDAANGNRLTSMRSQAGLIASVHEHRPGWYSLVGRSGRISHYRLGSRAAIYSADTFVRPDGSYAALVSTPDGLFTGDEEVFDEVVYRLGSDVAALDMVTADQLFERFHRSTLVRDFWEGRPLSLPEDLRNGVGRPPVVEIQPLGERLESQRVRLRLRATNRGGGVGEVRVYVNGARVGARFTTGGGDAGRQSSSGEPGGRGLFLVRETGSGSATIGSPSSRPTRAGDLYGPGHHELDLHLAPGENVITAEAYSVLGAVRGLRARDAVDVEVDNPQLPTLYLLALSVGAHADPSINLGYASADADAIVSALERQQRRIFENVRVIRLADRDATRESVLRALATVRRHARPQDVFIIYVASHGVVGRCEGEAQASYHLILHGATRRNPCRDALPIAGLTALTAAVPAQEKLMLLDTCQSGGAVDERILDQLRGRLRDEGMRNARAAGVAVVAASAASESSFEVAELGHGLFTVALLRGLEGRATFEQGRRVGVSNLVRYVTRHLPILSERFVQTQQTPTYGMLGSDFTVALLRNDDPPLLAFADAGALDTLRQSERGLRLRGSTVGPDASIRAHVGRRATGLARCTELPSLEIVARWDPRGNVRFSAVRGDSGCVRRALGDFRVESPARGGTVRTLVGTRR